MEQGTQSGGSASAAGIMRFGPFELDLQVGELRKEGRRIRLQQQPFQILRMLLESPGGVVLREDIRSRLWPSDTIVEFDHSINAAVKRLRDALRDSADKPRYIETLARRGYRFIGQVEGVAPFPTVEPPPVSPGTSPGGAISPRPRADRPRVFIPVFLAAMVLLGFAGAWYYRRTPERALLQPLVRLDVDLGNSLSPDSEGGADAILSPDGTRLVYVSQSRLFTRRLDQPKATGLAGTERALTPFFSPDGQWVAFFAGGKLKKVPVQGGPAIVLYDHGLANGASWGEDGNIIVALDIYGLSRIPSSGGAPTPVTRLAPGEIVHRWPQVLPGGRAVLFSAYSSMTGLDGANIEVLSLRDGRRKTLLRGGTWGRYSTSGHLVYINKGTLFAVRFDPDRLEVHGTPVPVLEEVAYSTAVGSAQIDFSRNGTLVYRSSRAGGGLVTVEWLDGSGHTQPLLPVPGNYLSPAMSPDGNRLALTSAGDVWVYDLQRAAMVRLTFGGGYGNPIWSPDGHYLAFRAAGGLFWTRADGTSDPKPLTQSKNLQLPWSFTADGKRLAFVERNPFGRADIWTAPVGSNGSGLNAGQPEAFLQTRFDERTPMFSPDGRWLAYASNESGTYHVYVQAFPDRHGKRQVSKRPGIYPVWSHDGHELFFRDGATQQVMVASYKIQGDSFLPDEPHAWSGKRLASFSTTRDYDLAPDGKHIVAIMPADSPQEPQDRVIFLLNFFDELRRRVPLTSN